MNVTIILKERPPQGINNNQRSIISSTAPSTSSDNIGYSQMGYYPAGIKAQIIFGIARRTITMQV